jgi:hypothetical protein
MRTLKILLLTLALALAACGNKTTRADGTIVSDEGSNDGFSCRRPTTIADCVPPPNSVSKDLWLCLGCSSLCSTPNPIGVCSEMTGDCRYFATGCYPKSYHTCDPSASDRLLGLCKYCFLEDGGLGRCNMVSRETGAQLRETSTQ